MRLHDPSLAVESRSISARKPFTASGDGFSLNCAVAREAHERAKLERVCGRFRDKALNYGPFPH
jgi:hypothetical protein